MQRTLKPGDFVRVKGHGGEHGVVVGVVLATDEKFSEVAQLSVYNFHDPRFRVRISLDAQATWGTETLQLLVPEPEPQPEPEISEQERIDSEQGIVTEVHG